MKDKLLYTMILILVAIAAFQGGYILRDRQIDEAWTEIRKLNKWTIDHGGRIEALETGDRREKTGSGKPGK